MHGIRLSCHCWLRYLLFVHKDQVHNLIISFLIFKHSTLNVYDKPSCHHLPRWHLLCFSHYTVSTLFVNVHLCEGLSLLSTLDIQGQTLRKQKMHQLCGTLSHGKQYDIGSR